MGEQRHESNLLRNDWKGSMIFFFSPSIFKLGYLLDNDGIEIWYIDGWGREFKKGGAKSFRFASLQELL